MTPFATYIWQNAGVLTSPALGIIVVCVSIANMALNGVVLLKVAFGAGELKQKVNQHGEAITELKADLGVIRADVGELKLVVVRARGAAGSG